MLIRKPLGEHLLRGGIGGGLFFGSYAAGSSHLLLAVVLGVGGLVALRGCPLCWLMGLVETLTHKTG